MSSKTRVDSTDKHGVESATKSLAKPKLFRRFFQFRLLALLLLVIPVAFAAIHVRNLLDDRPVNWKPYSKAEVDQHIRDQETVLVFLTFDNGEFEAKVFGSQRVRQIIRYRKITAMKLDTSSNASSEDFYDLIKMIGGSTIPGVAIFSAQSGGQPVVVDWEDLWGIAQPEEDQVYKSLAENSSLW